jgi:hypothetical protein
MRIHEIPGQERIWAALPFRRGSDTTRLAVKTHGWIGGLAFALPLVMASITDLIANSPTSNAPSVFAMFELLAISILAAAGMCYSTIMKRPEPIGQRLAMVLAVWSLLFLETGCALLWLMRGLH